MSQRMHNFKLFSLGVSGSSVDADRFQCDSSGEHLGILRINSKQPYDLEIGPNDGMRCERAPRDSCQPIPRERAGLKLHIVLEAHVGNQGSNIIYVYSYDSCKFR